MLIYFNDPKIENEPGFTTEMVTVPRAGEDIYFGVNLLPESLSNFLNLNADDGDPVVKVFTWRNSKVICAKVRHVLYVVHPECHGINVEVDFLAGIGMV